VSNDLLRDLLHELGTDHPPVHIDPNTYRRGRRAHWRRAVAGSVAGTLALVAGVAVVAPMLGQDPAPSPVTTTDAPAMPTRLYEVPERLAPHLGGEGYLWHRDVASDGLAIGTTAAVFPVNQGAVVAVSALDGSYHGLELPGFDPAAYFRFGGPPVALSPEGDRLAYTWNPRVIGERHEGYLPSGVRIVDLDSGRVTSTRIEEGFGVFAHDFSWSPDGRYLAYNLHITTNETGGVHGSRNFRVARLDTTTGEHTEVPGLPQVDDGGLAVSSRGEVAAVHYGRAASWLPGRRPSVVRGFEGGVDDWSAAWSLDGRRLAAGSRSRGWFSVGAPDGRGLVTRTAADAPPGSTVRALGWTGDEEVALLHRTPHEEVVVSAVPTTPAGGPARRLVELEGASAFAMAELSLATDLLARPTREFPQPDWPLDWPVTLAWGGSGLLALALVSLWARSWRRVRADRLPTG
jgi:hypothetical protein